VSLGRARTRGRNTGGAVVVSSIDTARRRRALILDAPRGRRSSFWRVSPESADSPLKLSTIDGSVRASTASTDIAGRLERDHALVTRSRRTGRCANDGRREPNGCAPPRQVR
jgi:hypothetical protein